MPVFRSMLVCAFIIISLLGCDESGTVESGSDTGSSDGQYDAETTCQDGACSTESPVGTWTDPESGLMWMDPPVNFAPGSPKNWTVAKESCESLVLEGHEDWRLPTLDELRTLIRGCENTMAGGACAATDACFNPECFVDSPPCFDGCPASEGPVDAGAGMGCYWPESFGMKASCFLYWSSISVPTTDTLTTYVATVNFDDATVDYFPEDGNLDIRCVR